MGVALRLFSDNSQPHPQPRPTPAERQAKAAARLAKLEIDVAVIVGGHSMERLRDLDDHRRELAGSDPTLNLVLAELEATTIAHVKRIQRSLDDPLAGP